MDGVKQFANKQFDGSLKRLVKDISDNFKLSIKGIFVFMAGYGLRYPELIEKHINDSFDTNGPEWRDDTDKDYDAAVDILIERYSSSHGLEFKSVRGNDELLKKVTDGLMKIANAVGRTWLDEDLEPFKNGVTSDEKAKFIRLMSWYLKQLNESAEPF